jgi:O-antigen ligase
MKSFAFPARYLQLAAFLTPPVAVLAPRTLAVILPLAALGAGLTAWHKRALAFPPLAPTLVVVAALAWGAASSLWAFEPRLVWSIWPPIAALAAAGLVLIAIALRLEDAERRQIESALTIGTLVALAILCIEAVSMRVVGHPLTAVFHARRPLSSNIFNRGVATLAILVWPAALGVWRRWGGIAAAAMVIVTLAAVSRFDSMAAIVGMIAGIAIGALAVWRPRPAAWVLAVLIAAGAAAAPVLPRLPAAEALTERVRAAVRPGNGIVSIAHRLEIWHFVAGSIAERPVAGWGLNSSRDLPGGIDEIAPGARQLPLHPHNAMLQWWLELGAVGAGLATLLVLLAVRGAVRLADGANRIASAAARATVCSGRVVALVGYGIWQAWWMSALWLAASLMATTGALRRP